MTTPETLRLSAQRFGLARVDRDIAAWIRRYADPQIANWVEAENALTRILLDLALIDPDNLMPADGESDVVANALARALGNCVREAPYSTDYLATLSALAFAAAGNFPNASVFAQRAQQNKNPGPIERWLIMLLASPRLDFSAAAPTGFTSYAQFIDHALKGGFQEDFGKARAELEVTCRESFESIARTDRYLLLFLQQIHNRFEELSAARILREIGFPNQAYIPELLRPRPHFSTHHKHALYENNLS